MASVVPSGETATDIDVPSRTVRLMRGDDPGCAPIVAHDSNATTGRLRAGP